MHGDRERYFYRGICGRVVDGDTLRAKLDLGFGCWRGRYPAIWNRYARKKRMVAGGTEDLKALGVLATEFVRKTIPQSGEIFCKNVSRPR